MPTKHRQNLVKERQKTVSSTASTRLTWVAMADHTATPEAGDLQRGKKFLEELANLPSSTFEHYFSGVAMRLGLSETMNDHDLDQLLHVAFLAWLCNIEFNAHREQDRTAKPNLELWRITMEQEFMTRKNEVLNCVGWKALRPEIREQAERIFFQVSVAENKLA